MSLEHAPDRAADAVGGKEKPLVINLWPDAGQALGLSKTTTYEAARMGQIPTVRFGRLWKVPVIALERMLAEAGGHGR
jgi:excisionase family DNA binding protein